MNDLLDARVISVFDQYNVQFCVLIFIYSGDGCRERTLGDRISRASS